MQKRKSTVSALGRVLMGSTLVLSAATAGAAQGSTGISDAQIEANVLKALASAPELSVQDIQSSTVYGVVTLTGTVQDEAMRTRAENLVARAPGVKKVVDEMALGTPAQAGSATASPRNPSAGGGIPEQDAQTASAEDGDFPAEPATPYAGVPPQTSAGQGQRAPASARAQQAPLTPPQGTPYPQQQAPYPAQAGNAPQPAYGQQPYPPVGQAPRTAPPAYSPYAYGQPESGYASPGYASPGGQPGGVAVAVPAGALLRVRINRGLDSNHIQPGTPWDGTMLNDVVAGGMIAIPRGAAVQGVVVDSKKAGTFKGEGELSLQVTRVQLGGAVFPLLSDLWAREGADKSVRTVNSALGLGVLGAIVGGVAGGGAGAAVGAGVGAGVGVAGSAASPGGRVIVPPEAALSFRLSQPAQVVTVSAQEMQRLAYAAGPGAPVRPAMVRRRPYPAYGPGYYAPAPYPYPY